MIAPQDDHFLRKSEANAHEFLVYERLLASSLKEFISELCLTNAGAMIAYICADHHDNIDDIITSSAELLLRPGLLRYAQSSSIEFEWGRAPSVTIDMEFCHRSLTAYFRIVFDGQSVGIDIIGILFSEPAGDADENLRRFVGALAEAPVATP
jgi:hypothetical protein